MGVAGKGEARTPVAADMLIPGFGIMLQDDGEGRRTNAPHGAGEVGAVGQFKVLFARDDDGVAATAYDAVLIAEQPPTAGPLKGDGLPAVGRRLGSRHLDVFGIVVIAQHRDDAVARPQLAEQRHDRFDLARLDVLQVAGEGDEVGMLRIDAVDIALQEMAQTARERTDMSIGEMHDAVAVECRRKVGVTEVDMHHLQAAEAHGAAVGQHEIRHENDDSGHRRTPVAVGVDNETAEDAAEDGEQTEDGLGIDHDAHKQHV